MKIKVFLMLNNGNSDPEIMFACGITKEQLYRAKKKYNKEFPERAFVMRRYKKVETSQPTQSAV